MKVELNNIQWWNRLFLWLLTISAFIFITAGVFFVITGEWYYLTTFSYWITTATTTFLALFLRGLWQTKGSTIAMTTHKEIKEKEEAKTNLIIDVQSNNLVGELEEYVINETRQNKITAWKNKCDYKVQSLSNKSVFKFRRKHRLEEWKQHQLDILDLINGKETDFNLDNVKISHYIITIDDILSVSNSPYDKNKKKRYSKGRMLKSSYQTNVLTLVASATVSGMNIIVGNFDKEDILLWISQILIFLVNIYSGYRLGIRGIVVDYSSDLSDDYVLLKKFLKQNKSDFN